MNIIDLSDIPFGWEESKLGDIIELKYGKGLRKDKRDPNGIVPVYGSNGIVGYHSEALTEYSSLIIGRKGSVGEVHLSKSRSWPIDTTYYVYPPKGMDLVFLYYLMYFLKLGSLDKSTAIPGINRNDVYNIKVVIPPSNEQKRIVSKIEELFTKLDAGIQELTLAKEKLKIYRQSVLKNAFDGKLTAEWREEYKDEIEINFSSNVHQDNYNSLNFSGLPEIPEEWTWALLGELGDLNRGKSKHRPRNDERLFGGKYPFIQTGEVKNSNGLITNYTKTYSDFGLEQSKLWPKGTLCITIAANIAETALLGIDACFPDSVVGFVPNGEICDINYINYFIKNIKNKIQAYAPATAQKNINLTILRKISVPLPPLNEQKLIVNEIKQSYSISENMEQTIDLSILKAQKLHQSILKKAFTGLLVPQDPNDEPAEQLLKRIKTEKEKQKPKRKTRKSKSKQEKLI